MSYDTDFKAISISLLDIKLFDLGLIEFLGEALRALARRRLRDKFVLPDSIFIILSITFDTASSCCDIDAPVSYAFYLVISSVGGLMDSLFGHSGDSRLLKLSFLSCLEKLSDLFGLSSSNVFIYGCNSSCSFEPLAGKNFAKSLSVC